MSSPKKAREISMRIIIIVLHALALAVGLVLLVIYPLEDVFFAGIGGAAIVEATIVLSYEIIMIVLIFVNNVNHRLRLLVDFILNFVMVGLLIATFIVILGLILFFWLSIDFERPSGLAIFLFPILPVILVFTVFGIPFFVSACVSWRIRRVFTSNSVHEESRGLGLQSSPVSVSPPPTSDHSPASKDGAL